MIAARASMAACAFAGSVLGGLRVPRTRRSVASLRAPLGIADHTLTGSGYGLTFDDGPHRLGTPAVFEALERHGVRATFFLVGEQVARNPGLAARSSLPAMGSVCTAIATATSCA